MFWSDYWCQEGQKSWLISGDANMLFQLDTDKGFIQYIDTIPSEKIFACRQHPICVKVHNKVFCIPDAGNNIYCYHIDHKSWNTIYITDNTKISIKCRNYHLFDNNIYTLSRGMKKIIEINTDTEEVTGIYDLGCKESSSVNGNIMIGKFIYIVGTNPTRIIKFDCSSKETSVYNLSEIEESLFTICYDANKFWLCGYSKQIYIWSEKENKITSIIDLPEKFGLYNFSGKQKQYLQFDFDDNKAPIFWDAVCMDKYIWFIPYQTNNIIFVNKDTYEIKIFYIDREEQSDQGLKKQLLKHMYILEYIRDNRYIGIYSLKNRDLIEIDCQQLTYKVLNFDIDTSSRLRIIKDSICIGNGGNTTISELCSSSIQSLLLYLENNDSNPEQMIKRKSISGNQINEVICHMDDMKKK